MATTIYTYLHKDDLKGSRIVSMDDCMCMMYDINRDDAAFFKDFNNELEKPALYILLNRATKQAYVGETDDFSKRIQQHIIKKGFWDEVLVFVDKNEDTISKTEVQYLEYLAYNKANDVKTFDISENSQSPKLPHMNMMQRGKTDKFFQYVQFLTQFVGCDIFSEKKAQEETHHMFFCTRSGCNAKGYMEGEKFVVLAGSELRVGFRDSAKPAFIKQRNAFIAANCDTKKGVPVLKQDIIFSSPSYASAMMVGGSSNGWHTWRDENGKTLDEVYRI